MVMNPPFGAIELYSVFLRRYFFSCEISRVWLAVVDDLVLLLYTAS